MVETTLLSQIAIARDLGKDRRTVAKRLHGYTPTEGKRGAKLYTLGQILSAFANDFAIDADGVSLDEARRRKAAAQAEIVEMEASQLKERLFDGELIAAWWAKIIGNANQKFLALPVKSAPTLFACETIEEHRSKHEGLLHEILDELAEYDPRADSGDAGWLEPPAKTDGKPMGGRKPPPKLRKRG